MRAMKDSGIEWIGEIPEGWNIVKIKHFSNSQVGHSFKSEFFSKDNNGVRLVRGDNITEGKLRWGEKTRYWSEVSDKLEKYLLKDGDIVISMDGSKVGKNYAMINKFELPLLLVQRVTRLRALNPLNQKYLFYFFKDERFQKHVDLVKTDPAIPHITLNNIINYEITLPSIPEQTRIASYLDKKCAAIDSAIEKQRASIDKLKEYRQAVITEAVTKGLNPDVPMKDSGVEWIGEIPVKWLIIKLPYLTSIRSGGTPDRNKMEYWNEGSINWMSSGEVNKEYVFNTTEKITELGSENSNAKLIPKHAVMVALNGQGKTKGMTAILEIDSTCNQSLAAFTCLEKKLFHKFLFYTFKSMYKYLRGAVGDGDRNGLSVSYLRSLRIVLPSLSEQHEIVAYLDKKCDAIDEALAGKEKLIEKLEEYKKSLIYEAVTGKIEITA